MTTIGKRQISLRGRPLHLWAIPAIAAALTGDNIEFDGPRGEQSMNAIRLENPGTTLTVRRSYIHNIDIGILSDAVPNPNSEVLVEYTEFADNCLSGWYAGYYHNIYLNTV